MKTDFDFDFDEDEAMKVTQKEAIKKLEDLFDKYERLKYSWFWSSDRNSGLREREEKYWNVPQFLYKENNEIYSCEIKVCISRKYYYVSKYFYMGDRKVTIREIKKSYKRLCKKYKVKPVYNEKNEYSPVSEDEVEKMAKLNDFNIKDSKKDKTSDAYDADVINEFKKSYLEKSEDSNKDKDENRRIKKNTY